MQKTLVAALAALLLSDAASAQLSDRASTKAQREQEESRSKASNRRTSDWRLFVSSGVFFTTGDYGTDRRTDTYFIPFTARARKGGFRLSATLPYLRVDGSRAIIPGVDDPIVGDPSFERQVRSGFGDLSLRARYRIPARKLSGFELDLLGRVKLPTGSERKRLSTGETDYAVGAEVSRRVGRVEPFVEVQYRINGDPPDRDYKNTVATSVGASTRIGRSTATLAYDYSQSRVRGRRGSHTFDASLARPLSRKISISGFGSVGLSERSPDFAVGSILTARVF